MTIILTLHIALMTASLVATSAMAIAAATSRIVSPRLVRLNAATTASGVVAGIILIVQNPIGVKCAALFGYVVAFAAVYVYVRRKNHLLTSSEA